MQVIADLANFGILQEERTPDLGGTTVVTGRFIVPVPEGVGVNISSSTYLLPQDGGDLASELADGLLALYPMYSNIVHNFLLNSADIAEFDTTATGPTGETFRAQLGRGVGPLTLGQAPNSTGILEVNPVTSGGPKPGCLVTDTIDIGPVTAGVGADEFLVWWKIWTGSTSQDVVSAYGATAGVNTPSAKSFTEINQETANLEVYISNDDGVTWTGPIGRLEPIDLGVFDTDVRLAFLNNGASRFFLGAYGICF